mgnify:CR=1 FL=1
MTSGVVTRESLLNYGLAILRWLSLMSTTRQVALSTKND